MRFTLPLLFLFSTSALHAQMFNHVGGLSVIPTHASAAEFGDLDNDGDDDLVLSGYEANNLPRTHVYLNNGGSFTEISTSIGNFASGSVDLADFDNDGDLDIAFQDISEVFIYRNDNLNFTSINLNINFKKQNDQGLLVQWIDLNNDGVLEIVAMGGQNWGGGPKALVYTFKDGAYIPVEHNLPNRDFADLHPADFNKDGLMDLLLEHFWGAAVLISKGNFVFETSLDVLADWSTAATGDFNNDGMTDFILSARMPTGSHYTDIYLNTNNGSFTRTNTNIPGMHTGCIEVADFNQDGLDDIYIGGSNRTYREDEVDESYLASLYLNQGNMNFVKESTQFAECSTGDVDIVDVNNDSKPDIFISGISYKNNYTQPNYFSEFYLNTITTSNNAPAVPQIKSMEMAKDNLLVKWDAPLDDTSDHLTYNVRIGSAPNQFDVLNPFTNGDHPLIFTSFTVPDAFKLFSVQQFGPVYVSVQSIDRSFKHSAYSAPVMFDIVPKADFSVSNTSVCANDEIEVNFEGIVGNATFQWSVNDASIAPSNNKHFTLQFGEPGIKTIKLRIEAGGHTDEKSIDVLVKQRPDLSISANPKSCFEEDYQIEYTGLLDAEIMYKPADPYTIVNGTNGSFINWNYPGNHQVNFSIVYNNCSTDGTVTVLVPSMLLPPEICIVTTETFGNESRNVIAWTSVDKTKAFNIFRETSQLNVFEKIGTVESKNSGNSFVDATSLPFQRAYRYQISAVDTCGYETTKSMPHKTIHLVVNKGQNDSWNLIWNTYQGFYYSSHWIYRAVDGQPLELLMEVPVGLNTYTDLHPPSGNVHYQVEVVAPHTCDDGSAGGRTQKKIASARSNIVATDEMILGVEDQNDKSVVVYPNPTYDEVRVKSNVSTQLSLTIFNSLSKESVRLELQPFGETTIPFHTFTAGMYFLHATDDTGKKTFTKKIIKK